MIDRCEIKRCIDALPWPDGKKPALSYDVSPMTGYTVLLHEPLSRGWTDIARFNGPTPERCFALALEKWVLEKGLNNQPCFFDAIKRLTN